MCPASVSSGRAGRLGSNRSRTTSQPTKRRTPRMPSRLATACTGSDQAGGGARRWGRRRATRRRRREHRRSPRSRAGRGGCAQARERDGGAGNARRDRSCRSGGKQRRQEHELDRPAPDDPRAEIDAARRAGPARGRRRGNRSGSATPGRARQPQRLERRFVERRRIGLRGAVEAWSGSTGCRGRRTAALLPSVNGKPRSSSWRRADEWRLLAGLLEHADRRRPHERRRR